MKKLFVFLLTMMLISTLQSSLCAQQLAERNPQYRLQCSDVLDIQYRYTPEFNQQTTVRPDGRITVSGMGDVVAEGLTLEQVTAAVTDLSKQRLKDPILSIVLKEFQKPYVIVGGEVVNPGRFELRGDLSALEAVTLAGGFKNSSSRSHVLLLRKSDSGHAETKVIDLKTLIAKGTLEEDFRLKAGDVLYIPQNTFSKVERLAHLGQFGMYYPIR
jgi:polysaccharide export outer membrane protein